MKKNFKISEISKLYGICNDSLRYYEKKGLLSPKRDNNGYRIYDLSNIWKLNVIKNLRELGFSSHKIKQYLDYRNLENTTHLLLEEVDIIDVNIKNLRLKKEKIMQKINQIDCYKDNKEYEVQLKNIGSRNTYIIDKNVEQDFEIDYLFNKVVLESTSYLEIIGNETYGAYVDIETKHHYSSVFIISDNINNPSYIIEEGWYLSIFYKGEYSNYEQAYEKIINYSNQQGMILTSEVIELFHIDIHETTKREEFITEVQVLVKKN